VARRATALVLLSAVLLVLTASAASEYLTNRTGKTATAVTVTFSEEVRITSHDESVFPNQEPAGRAETFTFSGGELADNGRFKLSWTPGSASVVNCEWLTGRGLGVAPPETGGVGRQAGSTDGIGEIDWEAIPISVSYVGAENVVFFCDGNQDWANARFWDRDGCHVANLSVGVSNAGLAVRVTLDEYDRVGLYGYNVGFRVGGSALYMMLSPHDQRGRLAADVNGQWLELGTIMLGPLDVTDTTVRAWFPSAIYAQRFAVETLAASPVDLHLEYVEGTRRELFSYVGSGQAAWIGEGAPLPGSVLNALSLAMDTGDTGEIDREAIPASVAPNAKPEYAAIIGSAFGRSSSDGIGGTLRIPNLGVNSKELQMKYTTFLELLRRNTGNEPEALRDSQAIIGPADTLHHGWGSEITVYVVSESDGMNKWVEQVTNEINVGLGRTYLRQVQGFSAEWVFDFGVLTGYERQCSEQGIDAVVKLSPEGDPLSCRFSISGLFAYEEDFKTRLRKTIVQTMLLYKDYDPALVSHLGYDGYTYFEKTGFSVDFLNLVSALGGLPNGREFAPDLNEVNRSPIAVTLPLLKARVGDPITLDASGSVDTDGNVVSCSWVQAFPTKLGTDYVSDQAVILAGADSAAASFTPAWPGNYRFTLTVVDDVGACAYATVNVEVSPTTSILGSVGGVAIGEYYSRGYQDRYYGELVQWLVGHNVGAVRITPQIWMQTVHSTHVELLASDESDMPNGSTIDDSYLRAQIQSIHAAGMAVILVPLVEVYAWCCSRWDIAPTNWTLWFKSYGEVILHYASIAAELGVEYFCVGSELAPTETHTSEWRELIRTVRAACPNAAITYESDTVYNDAYYTQVQFWDDLDFIGVSAYIPGSGDANTWGSGRMNPTSAEMEANITAWYARTVARVAKQFGKPVLFLEAGCEAYDGSNQAPWMYVSALMQNTLLSREQFTFDFRERIDYYEALGRFVSKTPEIVGVFFWSRVFMDPWNFQQYFVMYESLEVRDPPISEFIRLWYDYPPGQ